MGFKSSLIGAALVALTSLNAASALAATFNVNAFLNSSTGGVGVDTITLTAGQFFAVSVNPSDLWSAGALPRWSNADGLTGNLFATGTDQSSQPAGTLIGQNFGLHAQGNLSAPFGTLVGQIGGGDFFVIGTSYAEFAAASGILQLYYWDSNFQDNAESVEATVNVVQTPLPGALPLFATGLGALGLLGWRRKRKAV